MILAAVWQKLTRYFYKPPQPIVLAEELSSRLPGTRADHAVHPSPTGV
jgi:hypothetical protein